MFLVPHIPADKRQQRQELETKYLAWRLSGGQTTVIKKEHLQLKRRGRWGGKLESEIVRTARMRFEAGA